MAEQNEAPAAEAQPQSSGGAFVPSFTSASLLSRYAVPFQTYLQQHPTVNHKSNDYPIVAIASGAVVIRTWPRSAIIDASGPHSEHHNPSESYTQPRVLLLRRAATDSMPNLWEVPGGAVDAEDPSILHGVARELFEEAGLNASHISALVGVEGGQVFATRRGLLVSKLHFLVEVGFAGADGEHSNVKLDYKEHSAFCWATEEECASERLRKSIRSGDGTEEVTRIPFTTPEQKAAVLEGFRVFHAQQTSPVERQ